MTQLEKDLTVAYNLLNRRKLRWCKGGICACMGCANREITKTQWDRIVEIPEIKVILEQQRKENNAKMQSFLQMIKDKKL